MNKQCTNGITKLDIKFKNYYLNSKNSTIKGTMSLAIALNYKLVVHLSQNDATSRLTIFG